MTSVILLPDALGVDAAYPPPLEDIKNAGYQFFNIYVGGSHDELGLIPQCFNLLLLVNLNYERRADAYLGGYNAGRAQAIDAINEAKSAGWIGESPITFSATDTTVLDYGLADSFYRGVADVFEPLYPGMYGAYGDEIYLQHLSEQPWWHGILWQWMNNGPTLPYATIRQTGHGLLDLHDIDINKVKKPCRFWSGFGSDGNPTESSPMFRHAPDGTVYEILMGHKIHCEASYFYDVLSGSIFPDTSGKVVSYPGSGIEALPDWPFTSGPAPAPITKFNLTFTGSGEANA